MVTVENEFDGYTFETTISPNATGNKITCTAYDSTGKEVTSASSCYGNGSGYGYAKMFAIDGCKAKLKEFIENNFKEPEKPEYNTDFLNRLANEGYIADYGELGSTGKLVVMFDSWSQAEGADEREYIEGQGMVKTGNFKKSVYAKLGELAAKNLLKPDINRTILEVEYVFTDEYMKCYECGKIYHTTWDDIQYVESEGVVLCSDCINESDDCLDALIEEAKDNFRKALRVEISEEKIEALGYVKVDDEQDFSTRYSEWGEKSYGAHSLPIERVEEICKDYNGFAKLTAVWQFDAEFNLYFPEDTVDEAREALGIRTGD